MSFNGMQLLLVSNPFAVVTRPATPAGGQEEQGRAWQQQMERAQGELALRQSLQGRGGPAETAEPAVAAATAAQAPAGPLPAAASPVMAQAVLRNSGSASDLLSFRELGAQLSRFGALELSMGRTERTPVLQQIVQRDAEMPVDGDPLDIPRRPGAREGSAIAARERTAAPHRTAPLPLANRPPVRLHADWEAQGVRLWLGLDAGLLGQVEAIALQVRRWMSTQGVRVLSFSCNGKPVPLAGPACLAQAADLPHDINLEENEAWQLIR